MEFKTRDKMISNVLLYNIITRKHDFCCLCLTPLHKNTITLEDEVILKEDVPADTLKIQEILSHVLGYKTVSNLSTFEAICKHCTEAAVNCYNFITKSRKLSEHLNNALNNLICCLDNTSDTYNMSKTLFITIESNNLVTQKFYDNHTISSSTIALKRLQDILGEKPMVKEEKLILKEEDECLDDKPLKKRRKYFSVPIKTREMLYDRNDPTNLKCKVCLKRCSSLPSLRNHYIRVHAPKDYECAICHRKFGSVALLEGHKTESHCTIVCSKCGKTFYNRHTLKMHEIGHHYKRVCQKCGRVYKSQSTYKKHIDLNVCGQKTRASPADAKFTCDYCKKKYTQKVSLRVHIQYEHGSYKGHECKWCQKTFYAISRLKAHIVKHTQEKNFPCNVCGGRFISKESLLYHTRIHTGEKPYKCEYCDDRFFSASRRSWHTKRHHADIYFQ